MLGVRFGKARGHFLHVFVRREKGEVIARALADEGGDGLGDVVVALAALFVRRFNVVGQQQAQVLGRERRTKAQQGIPFLATEQIAEVRQRRERGREEHGCAAAL